MAGDKNSHDAKARAADGDRVIHRIGASLIAVARQPADRVISFPEIAERLTPNEVQQPFVREFLPPLAGSTFESRMSECGMDQQSNGRHGFPARVGSGQELQPHQPA